MVNTSFSNCSEAGSYLSCWHGGWSDGTILTEVKNEWEGAGTYNVGVSRETYEQEEIQLYAETPKELTDLIKENIKEIYSEIDFADELDFLEHYDYIEKVMKG